MKELISTGESRSPHFPNKAEMARFDALLAGFEQGDPVFSTLARQELQTSDSHFVAYLVEKAIIERKVKGSCPAFCLLYEQHQTALTRHLQRIVRNIEEAQQLAQETFYLAWLNLPEARDETKWKFRNWLYKIAQNIGIDHIRRKETEEKFYSEIAAQITIQRQFVESFEEVVSRRELFQRALERMTPCYRQALIAEITRNTLQSETATSLGISESTLSGYISRGRKELQSIYQQLLQEANER